MAKEEILQKNGWSLYVHSVFKKSLEELIERVDDKKKNDPLAYKDSVSYRTLECIYSLIHDEIPGNPNARKYYLKKELKQLRRAKFRGRYRLFFWFSSSKTLICYIWFNNDSSLRKNGSISDPYNIIQKVIGVGTKRDPIGSIDAEKEPLKSYNVPNSLHQQPN